MDCGEDVRSPPQQLNGTWNSMATTDALREEANAAVREVELSSFLNTTGRERLRFARREVTEAAALRDEFASTLTLAQRERRLAASSLKDVEDALAEAEAQRAARERDCRGLRRTLERIQARLGEAAVEFDQVKPYIVKVKETAENLDVEERNLTEQVENITEVAQTLRKRVAQERETRLKLKASARAKLEREEEANKVLMRQKEGKQAELDGLKQQVENQRKATQAAQAEMQKTRQELQQAQAQQTGRSGAIRALQLEVLQLEQEHHKMREELATMIATFEARVQKREDARRAWNLNHLAKVDARLERHREVDQEVLVA